MSTIPISEIQNYVGANLGASEWIKIDQARVNSSAEVTGDFQFVGIDAHEMVDRCMNVGHIMRILNSMITQLIGRSVDYATPDAPSCHPNTETE